MQVPGATFESIHGPIVSKWRIERDVIQFHIQIPPNTTATVYIPNADPSKVQESGKPATQSPGVKLLRNENQIAIFEIGSGDYRFTAQP